MKSKLLLYAIAIMSVTPLFLAYPLDNEPLVIDNGFFNAPRRPAAVFDHDMHNETAMLEEDCGICHHVYEDGKKVEDASSEDSYCSDCHSLKKTADNPVPLKIAFHKRCKSCHFEVNKGPVLCGECHKKR